MAVLAADPRPKPLPLPSLNALLVFETAARHQSFTRAAAELGVTQTAVSHQVKALEGELGVVLFRRSPRRLVLTGDGQAWAAELQRIFYRLREVNTKLRSAASSERPLVAVSIIPSFAARWLVPRLGRFLEEHPNIDVRLSASGHLVDFDVEPFDLGIRYGSGRYPGLVSEKLADDAWIVVASPALLARSKLRSPLDLARQTLLYDDDPHVWSRWFEGCGVRDLAGAHRHEISDSGILVDAAIRGQGIALARWALAYDDLAAGRLSVVFPKQRALPTGKAYYVVGPRETLRRAPVAAFRRWVGVQAGELRAAVVKFGG
jgi:LysR family transcriptional regulator, glycine cleavage system transcriptional activator